MKQSVNQKGYMQVSLMLNGQKSNLLVHRIVAAAFIGECPKGNQVAHNDGIKTNNHVSNIRYTTPIENIADRERHGHTVRGSMQSSAKINERIAGIIYKLRNSGISSTEIGLITGLSNTNIQRIWNKQLWVHATEK